VVHVSLVRLPYSGFCPAPFLLVGLPVPEQPSPSAARKWPLRIDERGAAYQNATQTNGFRRVSSQEATSWVRGVDALWSLIARSPVLDAGAIHRRIGNDGVVLEPDTGA